MFTFALVKQNNGAIAQLVEQRTENPCVPGSIPGGTTFQEGKTMQTPEFQRSSGVFLFQEEAKLVGLKQTIRPYSRDCFQKP